MFHLEQFSSFQRNYTIFNRSRELNALYYTLKSQPQWTVVSGPVNSGKSKILMKVAETLRNEKQKTSIIHLDLRSRTFRNVDTFASTMLNQLRSWFSGMVHSVKKIGVKMDVTDRDIELILELTKEDPTKDPTKKRQVFFDSLSEVLPNWNWLRGYDIPTPVLIIDELIDCRLC